MVGRRSLEALVLVTSLFTGCLDQPQPEAAGAKLEVDIAALSLSGVGDVVWDLEVLNGAGEVVWQRRLTSSRYGDSAGSVSYVGPCDADPAAATNTINLWVVGLYEDDVAAADAGAFNAGLTSGVGAVTGTPQDFQSPTATGPLTQTAVCRENADVPVRFDVTVMRPALQGFFDIAVDFNDIFCSAKYDCCYDATGDGCAADGSEDILALFDETGARGPTHVLALACTAGPGSAVDTTLFMDALALDCTPPNGGAAFSADLLIDPASAPAGNLCTPDDLSACPSLTEQGVDADTHLFQVATYRGEEALLSGGVSAQKVYWNVALGVRDVSTCRLRARASADDAADPTPHIVDGAITPGTVYPTLVWDVDLAACGSEPLTFGDPSAPVTTAYTSAEAAAGAFPFFYSPGLGAGSFCTPACQNGGLCEGGVCDCPPAFVGPTCATPATPLTISPTSATVPMDGTQLFGASGGAGGYTFSLASGIGSIDAATGLYTAPPLAGQAVVRVTDALGQTADANVTVSCADATITTNTTLPAGTYCYGTLTITNNAVLTLGFDAATGTGVTIQAQNIDLRAGASISADAQGYAAGQGPGAGSGHLSGATNQASSGGGHGGAGGNAGCTGPTGGAVYGDPMQPTTAGSGGDTSGPLAGGRGGGLMRLEVAHALTVNGTISARGGNGTANYNYASGAGAGGGIWVTAESLAGAGTIAARGGNGAQSTYGCPSGAGGGGRIAVYAGTHTSTVTYDVASGTGGNAGGGGSIARELGGVLTLWNINLTVSGARSWVGLVIPSNSSTTVPAGASLSLQTLSVTGGTLDNQGTLQLGTSVSLADGARYIQGAAATLDAATATLTVPSGTGLWDIAPTAPSMPTVAAVTIPAAGTLSHSANAASHTQSLLLHVTGDVTVDGAIDVSAKGFGPQSGPGAGTGNGQTATNQSSSGGGYGGVGGATSSCAVLSGGPTYGDPLAPDALGSGGASSGAFLGGQGGGQVHLVVDGTLAVNGAIRANGGNGSANLNYASGGGSGGSVWIDTTTLTGAGTIIAKGGAGIQSGFGCRSGAGGGGRVAVYAANHPGTETYDLSGGTGPVVANNGAAGTRILGYGAAMDVWNAALTLSGTTTWSTLTVANNASVTVPSGATLNVTDAVVQGTLTNQGSLSIANGLTLTGRYTQSSAATLTATTAALSVPSGTPLWDIAADAATLPLFASATIASGATLSHTGHSATHVWSLLLQTSGNLTVAGSINVNGKGFGAQSGPGAGAGNTQTATNQSSSGAGHGGNGGAASVCSGSPAGGLAYGSASAPTQLGSGGASSGALAGGAGGGMVRLVVGGTLSLGGSITADGLAGTFNYNYASGGGAGGTVRVDTATLSGAGVIYARGGGANRSTYGCNAGAGGGGRVVLNATTNSSTVSTSVAGGTGIATVNNGGVGSKLP